MGKTYVYLQECLYASGRDTLIFLGHVRGGYDYLLLKFNIFNLFSFCCYNIGYVTDAICKALSFFNMLVIHMLHTFDLSELLSFHVFNFTLGSSFIKNANGCRYPYY